MPSNRMRRPPVSKPDKWFPGGVEALSEWAPWAQGVIDGLTNSMWEPGVHVDDDGATLRLYDSIGFWGVTADDFANAIGDTNRDAVTVRINSPGGDVFDGLAIRSQIAAHPGHVTVVVDGIAASAASFITTAADQVTMMPGSQLMIHDALGLAVDNADGMRGMADLLDLQSDNIADLYTARAGHDRAHWRALMQAETWYLAADAVESGLADTVETADERPSAPADTLRMAWTEWIAAYAGRAHATTPPPQPDPPKAEPVPVGGGLPGWDPHDLIARIERRGDT